MANIEHSIASVGDMGSSTVGLRGTDQQWWWAKSVVDSSSLAVEVELYSLFQTPLNSCVTGSTGNSTKSPLLALFWLFVLSMISPCHEIYQTWRSKFNPRWSGEFSRLQGLQWKYPWCYSFWRHENCKRPYNHFGRGRLLLGWFCLRCKIFRDFKLFCISKPTLKKDPTMVCSSVQSSWQICEK